MDVDRWIFGWLAIVIIKLSAAQDVLLNRYNSSTIQGKPQCSTTNNYWNFWRQMSQIISVNLPQLLTFHRFSIQTLSMNAWNVEGVYRIVVLLDESYGLACENSRDTVQERNFISQALNYTNRISYHGYTLGKCKMIYVFQWCEHSLSAPAPDRGVRSARYQTSPGVYDIRLSMWTFCMTTEREKGIWLIGQSSNVREIIICNIEEKRFILDVCSRFGQSLTLMHTHSMFIDVLWILRYDLIWNSYIKIN